MKLKRRENTDSLSNVVVIVQATTTFFFLEIKVIVLLFRVLLFCSNFWQRENVTVNK